MHVEKNISELQNSFKDQIYFLVKSTDDFDNGDTREIIRTTVHLRNFLKDTNRITSLLAHLDKKDIEFLSSTSKKSDSNLVIGNGVSGLNIQIQNSIYLGLCTIHIESHNNSLEYRFQPLIFQNSSFSARRMSFEEWWNENVYEIESMNIAVSRKDIILSIAEKDGGNHIDKDLPFNYHSFKQRQSEKIIVNQQEIVFRNNPAFATVRQIIYEFFASIKQDEYLKDLIDQEPKNLIKQKFEDQVFNYHSFHKYLDYKFHNYLPQESEENKLFDLIQVRKIDFRHFEATNQRHGWKLPKIIQEYEEIAGRGEPLLRAQVASILIHLDYPAYGTSSFLPNDLVYIINCWSKRN